MAPNFRGSSSWLLCPIAHGGGVCVAEEAAHLIVSGKQAKEKQHGSTRSGYRFPLGPGPTGWEPGFEHMALWRTPAQPTAKDMLGPSLLGGVIHGHSTKAKWCFLCRMLQNDSSYHIRYLHKQPALPKIPCLPSAPCGKWFPLGGEWR